MIDMAQAVATGSRDLNNFALVAGVSAKEFQERFKTDAAGALIGFIDGLGRMSEAGKTRLPFLMRSDYQKFVCVTHYSGLLVRVICSAKVWSWVRLLGKKTWH